MNPSHAARYTREALTNSTDPILIENFWSLLKSKVYENGKKYSSKNCLWEAIQSFFSRNIILYKTCKLCKGIFSVF